MSSYPSPSETALKFRFLGEDRLYTDHEGRRVIVDVEGSGSMRLIKADAPILTLRDGGLAESFGAEFGDGTLVLATAPGEVEVHVLRGRTARLEGGSIRAQGNYFGCGWVVAASGPYSVDDRHEAAPPPSEGFPVPFFRSVRGDGSWSIVPAASVVCERVDAFSIGDEAALKERGFKVQNISALSELNSTFADGTPRLAEVASHLNTASFSIPIPADNLGLILRKTYDRFHGRQRARVFIDDAFAGWWYEAGEDRVRRWHVSDFGVDPNLTAGKSSIRISVDPPAGVALWSVSLIEVFALRPIE